MPFTKVVEIEEKLPNGYTSPFKVKCDDGKQYVLKYICDISNEVDNDEINGKILFNELISARIAKKLGLKIPNFKIVYLSKEVINNDNELKKYAPKDGLCFASEFIDNSFAGISTPLLKIAKNNDMLPEIIVFDQLIMNIDRSQRVSNILFNPKDKCFYIIDNTESFDLGGIWEISDLEQRMNNIPPTLVNNEALHGTCYSYLGYFVKNKASFDNIIDKIHNIDLNDIMIDIPIDWNIKEEEKKFIIEFLKSRIKQIDDILLELQKKKVFPNWKEDN